MVKSISNRQLHHKDSADEFWLRRHHRISRHGHASCQQHRVPGRKQFFVYLRANPFGSNRKCHRAAQGRNFANGWPNLIRVHWHNNGIICSDGSTAGLTRTLTDGQTNDGATTYSRTASAGQWITTISDGILPAANQQVVKFVASGTPVANFYETQRAVYQDHPLVPRCSRLIHVTTVHRRSHAPVLLPYRFPKSSVIQRHEWAGRHD